MGSFTNFFSKINNIFQTVSDESPCDSEENMSISKNDDYYDLSQISYDSEGWLIYPDGLRCRNVSQMFNGSFNESLSDVINDTKEKLGYKAGEAFHYQFNASGKVVSDYENTFIVGIWELFTNKILCFVRLDSHVMDLKEIEEYKRLAANEWNQEIWGGKIERGMSVFHDIWKGILEHSISQNFIEKVFGEKAHYNNLVTDTFCFTFENSLLSKCEYDDFDVMVLNYFDGEKIDNYLAYAKSHYMREKVMKILISLQAIFSTRISKDIILSSDNCRKFAFDDSGQCINYIAMGAFYRQFDVDIETFIQSTNGNYEIILDKVYNGIKTTKIIAYGEVFTFINGHSMPEEAIDPANNENFGINTEGYVYVMTNPSIEGQVKIGKTTRNPYERANELSSATGVPTPFAVVFYKWFKDCHYAEKIIHQYLEGKGYRVNNNREFFSMSIAEAIDVVQSMYVIENEQE